MSKTLHHLGFKPEDIGKYVLLPGDPKRVKIIAQHLENPTLTADFREYTTYTGTLEGEKVSVVSTGIGGPSTAIAVEELAIAGVHTIIRVGTCGAFQERIAPETLIIPTGAIRNSGVTDSYIPKEFPAVPDFSITLNLINSAKKLNYIYESGIVDSKDSYYGQHNPETIPLGNKLSDSMEMYRQSGTLASEMECASLFIVSTIRKIRSGAILSVCSNCYRDKIIGKQEICFDTNKAIITAVETIRQMILSDKSNKEKL